MADALQLAYCYRLYPTKAQASALAETLETCRQVYNSLLNWRKHDHEVLGKSPSIVEQQAAFPKWKKEHAELSDVCGFSATSRPALFSQQPSSSTAIRTSRPTTNSGD